MSITKYRTNKHYDALIEAVECERETEKCVYLIGRWGGTGVSKSLKETDYEKYHDSWEVAHNYLLANAENALLTAKRRVDSARSTLETVKALRAPKAAA